MPKLRVRKRQSRAREPVADGPLPAKQERSRQTTERLLDAAEELLGSGGADAATLRAIAHHAGVSLGIVYQRFVDKDAVLRAVYTRFFDRVASSNARALSNERLSRGSLSQTAAAVLGGVAQGYSRNRRLLRALVLYARTHPDSDFRARAANVNGVTMAKLIEVLDVHRSEISHPRPDIALWFALGAMGSLFAEHIVFADATNLPSFPHEQLVHEAVQMFVAYLTFA